MLKLYNTRTRKKEEFNPVNKNYVGMYACGPTVYNYAHIGNLRTYIFEDILRRVLEYNNYKVKHIINITDVGHLTSDSDEGEDKIEKGAKREGKTVWEIAEFYTNAFREDIKKLNILEPKIWCKATEHIKEMVGLIKKLEENGFTYLSGGNVYFDVSKFKEYGKLAKLKLGDLKAGARIEVDKNKKSPYDFVLWFTEEGSKFKNHVMKWESPWGTGWPGWHIECSAMSIKYLGEQIDIHCGGIDHVPVHHTNEIAQSECATGKSPWVKYWLHSEFLIMDKEKMAKSSGDFIRLQTLIDKGFDPMHYRYFCLNAHYRKKINFSWEALEGAKNSFENLKTKILEIKENQNSKSIKNSYQKDFKDFVNDDLDIPRAMSVMWAVIKDKELGNKEKYGVLIDFDKILGFGFENFEREDVNLTKEQKDLIQKREKARKEKNWELADEIRAELLKEGIIIEDTKEGFVVKKSN